VTSLPRPKGGGGVAVRGMRSGLPGHFASSVCPGCAWTAENPWRFRCIRIGGRGERAARSGPAGRRASTAARVRRRGSVPASGARPIRRAPPARAARPAGQGESLGRAGAILRGPAVRDRPRGAGARSEPRRPDPATTGHVERGPAFHLGERQHDAQCRPAPPPRGGPVRASGRARRVHW